MILKLTKTKGPLIHVFTGNNFALKKKIDMFQCKNNKKATMQIHNVIPLCCLQNYWNLSENNNTNGENSNRLGWCLIWSVLSSIANVAKTWFYMVQLICHCEEESHQKTKFFNLWFFQNKLRGIDTLSREATLSKWFLPPFWKGSTLKGKKLLPWEQILIFQNRLFLDGHLGHRKSNRISQKLSLFYKMAENLASVSSCLTGQIDNIFRNFPRK